VGGSATELSVTESCHGRGGDRAKMLPCVPEFLVNTAHIPKLIQSSGGQRSGRTLGGRRASGSYRSDPGDIGSINQPAIPGGSLAERWHRPSPLLVRGATLGPGVLARIKAGQIGGLK
jgi:hypothetical protein